jgi:hypothetical protein
MRAATGEVRLEGEAADVQAIYRGVVIASRCLQAGQRFLVGAGAEVDAPLPLAALPGPVHALVSAGGHELLVTPTEGMSVHRTGPSVQLTCGEVLFLVAPTEPPQRLPRPALLEPRKEGPAFAAAAALLVLGALLAALPPGRETLSLDPDPRSDRRVTYQIVPPVPVLPSGASRGGQAGPQSPSQPKARPARRQGPSAPGGGLLGVLKGFTGKSGLWSTADGVDEASVLDGLQDGSGPALGGLEQIGTGSGGPLGTIGTGQMTTACQGDCRGLDHARLGGRRALKVPSFPAGEVKVRGGMDREIVRRVVRNHLNEVRYCYERALPGRPSLAGRVVATFTILPTGRVASSVIGESTLKDAAVEGCIAASVRRWEFPRTEGLVIVSYPFALITGGE